jgi:hypothetical protein
MLLFVNDADHCLTAREATIRERLLTAAWSGRLDRALADGASPEGSALLALRSQQLVRPQVRRELGRTVRDIIAQAWEPLPRRPALTAEAHQRAVQQTTDVLKELADCLLAAAPVSARGVARAYLLITHPASPLYYPPPGDQLHSTIEEAVVALAPPRTW